ncbi:ScbA/BarX family gamma-butyrolactone biosynthesis protein [Streptomyces sp. NPDC007088]|uniref:ScbA/BarX family gamma-butyrolactone biosynthesis protein n=1 Tax=Streptomyces sp. NPDC007088 TaxID=3364773 RepID=UPI0036A099F5
MASTVRGIHTEAHRAALPDITAGKTPSLPALPVERTLVHRARLRDVLPTRLRRHDETHFTVSVRRPRTHQLFVSPDGRSTASMVLEAIRQSTLLISHAELGVPLGHHFVMWDLCHRLDTELPALPTEATPDDALTLDVRVVDLRRRGAVPASAHLEMELRAQGRPIGSGSIRFQITSPAAYTRIRGQLPSSETGDALTTLTEPVQPSTVHHTRTCDVVLSPAEGPGQWQLRADPRNELFFDHANDHVPAMVLVEAAQQAAHLAFAPGRFVASSSEMRFSRYVEFATPCTVEAHPVTDEDGTTSVSVTGHQDGQLAFVVRFAGSVVQ